MPDNHSAGDVSLAQLLERHRKAIVPRSEQGSRLLADWDRKYGSVIASTAAPNTQGQPEQNQNIEKSSFNEQQEGGSVNMTKDRPSANDEHKDDEYDSDDEKRKYQQWLTRPTRDELRHNVFEALSAPRSQGQPVLDMIFEAAKAARNRMVHGASASPSQPNSTHDKATAQSTRVPTAPLQSSETAAPMQDNQTDGSASQG
jgi:hypothetical protein